MRALCVREWGAVPELVATAAEPAPAAGRTLVRVSAAALNPVDLAIAAGRFYMPIPDPPFVSGAEAAGTVAASAVHPEGARVWCLAMTGTFGELASAPDDLVAPLPDGVSDELAAALGIAGLAGWMPVRRRGALVAGETVVVLGASGVVGQVAVQAARAGGAARVVAVARSEAGRWRALALGADAAVPTGPDLSAELRAACGGGADLVIDALWGPSAAAAIGVLRRGGRLVQVGSAESQTAELVGGPLRGGRLDIRGFSVFSERPADVVAAYGELAAAAARGEIRIDLEAVPLEQAPEAWSRQAAGTGGTKLVLVP
jgi:NADPH:quinone reductase-like Zn-dependent oxidoreductase